MLPSTSIEKRKRRQNFIKKLLTCRRWAKTFNAHHKSQKATVIIMFILWATAAATLSNLKFVWQLLKNLAVTSQLQRTALNHKINREREREGLREAWVGEIDWNAVHTFGLSSLNFSANFNKFQQIAINHTIYRVSNLIIILNYYYYYYCKNSKQPSKQQGRRSQLRNLTKLELNSTIRK